MNRSSTSAPARIGAALLLTGLAALGGCGYDPTYYQVLPVSGAAQAGGPSPVEVRAVSFPLSLDRDQIVTRAGERLTLDSHAAWSEAPGTQIGRALAADLAQRLPGSSVFLQGSATSTTPAVLVDVTITDYSGDGQGQAVLAGSLAVHRQGAIGPAVASPVRLVAPAGAGTQALVAALNQLVGQLADQAAVQIRAMPAFLPPPEPAPPA